jgi:hypothetical protein
MDDINRALGTRVSWSTKNGRGEEQKFVIVDGKFHGDLLVDSREPVARWLADHLERFISVFRPRIDQILREQ